MHHYERNVGRREAMDVLWAQGIWEVSIPSTQFAVNPKLL